MANANGDEFVVRKNEEPVTVEDEPLFKRILVPIDKSGGYKAKVLVYGIKLAKALGSEITVIHVIDGSSITHETGGAGSSMEGKTETYQEDYDDLKKQAEKILREARLRGEEEGLRVVTEIVTKAHKAHSIAEAIIDCANKNDTDLILLGSKGLVGLEKFLLGSVASKVISHAHCPVLAVR
jgi:nucleotide-binding universal stress UspA family protein